MKKHLFFYLFILLSMASLQAQELSIDNKIMEARRVKPDTTFAKYLAEKASLYSDDATKSDSAEVLYIEAIAVAEKTGYTKGLLMSREALAQYYYVKGKLSPSLNLLLKNEATALEINDSTSLFKALRIIANIYMKIGDVNMLRATLNRRQFILDNNGIRDMKDTSYCVLSQYNSLGMYYSLPQLNKQDSSAWYFRKIRERGINTPMSNLWSQLSSGGLGKYFSAKEKYDSAAYYYNLATRAALAGNRLDNYNAFLVALADMYRKSGQLDSAFKYAYRVYYTASQYSYIGLLASSGGLLATLYKQEHRYDSAVKYMTIESQYKDSVSGQETLKSIQVLTSEQQLKEKEKQREKEEAVKEYKATLRNYLFAGGLLLLLLVIGFMYRVNKQRAQSKKQIEKAYHDLKSTQSQLIQSEKMASLGELTAGIAHEIQNPLNFVNNFSDVNKELLEELKEEADKGNIDEVKAIANDIIGNEEKINHHGKRADAIVKGMLQHSRKNNGVKEPTDINKLANEYLRLSYHGLRAKDKNFNADFKTDFDETIGKINIVPQDMGRVILNLFNNAFYAVNEKNKQSVVSFQPSVFVQTKKTNHAVEIVVQDNGNGIPQPIIDKIFQPFFTTKPTGEGTGLGLSLSYDIITKEHYGAIKAESKEGEETRFIITLPA